MTPSDVELIHTATIKAVQKNWILLSVYGVVTVLGIVGSYFTNKWGSVALSVLVAAVTFFVGCVCSGM